LQALEFRQRLAKLLALFGVRLGLAETVFAQRQRAGGVAAAFTVNVYVAVAMSAYL
jgi:hypothetical protein